MAVADYVESAKDRILPSKGGEEIPEDVERKLKRGKERLKQVSASRKLAVQFARGKHYGVLSEDQLKVKQLSVTPISMGGSKPDHRVRLSRPLLAATIKTKVAAATQRVPSYECNPATSDPEDRAAASLAQKVAASGYDLWKLKRAFKKLVWNALVTEEGFICAYWDPNVGPYVELPVMKDVEEEVDVLDPETGQPTGVKETITTQQPTGETETIGMGEVAAQVYSGLEVMWEPGVEFEESPWIAIEHARPVEDVEGEPGFEGGKLKPDADANLTAEKSPAGTNLVLVTEFLERPCPKYPKGRRLFFADGRQIFPEEDYPLQNTKGEVVDEPYLKRLTWNIDPSSDRDRGLVRDLIDIQREHDTAGNKIDEALNLMVVGQWMSEEGAVSQNTPLTDEPGAHFEFRPTMPGQKPPERIPLQPPPQELFQIQDRAQQLMSLVSHDGNLPNQIQAYYEQAQMADQDFYGDLASVHSGFMRDALTLVQLHYTEERMVKFRGRTGWDRIADFKGADIRDQTDVRVLASHIEPRTRSSIEQRIMNIAQMFPGYFPPEVLLSALEGGTAEGLIEGYEDDVARANEIIGQIKSGAFYELPKRPVFPGEEPAVVENEETGQQEFATEMPGWMPRPHVDNVSVWKAIFANFMKSDEWNHQLDDAQKAATMNVFGVLLDLEMKEAQRTAQMQSEQAAEIGMANAAGGGSKPLPSLPALNNGSGGGAPQAPQGPPETSPSGPAQ